MAGLTAAYELVHAGFDVQVFEARQRVGGRVHTVFLGAEQHGELGAEFVDDNYTALISYATQFNLKLEFAFKFPDDLCYYILNETQIFPTFLQLIKIILPIYSLTKIMKKFKCGNCGLSCDADLNKAKMIALLGLSVNQPGGSNGLCCNLSTDSSGLLKAHTDLAVQCG